MPLYNFRCTNEKCAQEFEKSVSLAEFDTKKVYCPQCQCSDCDGVGRTEDASHAASKECRACKGTGKTLATREIAGLRATSSTWKYWRT